MRGADPTQAILEMQVLTQSYPELSGPHANLGLLYRNANQLAESEAALAKATERAPWDAQTWTEYGVTLRQAGKFAEARKAYEKAIEVNPSYAPAHRNLGVVLDLFLDDPVTAQSRVRDVQDAHGRRQAGQRLDRRTQGPQQGGRVSRKGAGTGRSGRTGHTGSRRLIMGKLLFCALLLLAGAAIAQSPAQTPAQSPPPAQPADSMEPGVNTSAPSSAPTPPASSPQGSTPATATPRATTAAPGAATANKPAARARATPRTRLDLESTQITGNRELPKVLYIVPWRSAELGDLVGRPVNSLLDEVLEPVDRDVFRRQNRYFEALQPNEAAPASKPEK